MTEICQIDHANNEEENVTIRGGKNQNKWYGPFVLPTAYKWGKGINRT